MTIDEHIPNKVESCQEEFRKKVQEHYNKKEGEYSKRLADIENDPEFNALIDMEMGRCCNCPGRFGCLKFMFAVMEITKEDFIWALSVVKLNCDKKYSWIINTNP